MSACACKYVWEGTEASCWQDQILFWRWYCDNWIHVRMKLNPFLTSYTKINSKWTIDLNVTLRRWYKSKTLWPWVRQRHFLTKSTGNKRKIGQIGHIHKKLRLLIFKDYHQNHEKKKNPYTLGQNIKELYVEYIKILQLNKRQLDLKTGKWFE